MFNSLQFPVRFASLFSVVLLAACAAPPQRPVVPKVGYVPQSQIKMQAKFDTVALSRDNFGSTAKSCMGTWTETGTSRVLADWKMPLPRGTMHIHSHEGHASYLLTVGDLGVCVQQSEQRHPILAGETLYKTANPEGVPPDVTEAWYAQIVDAIARSRTATVIYKFDNGNAQVVKYWVEASNSAPSSLRYWAEFKRAGQWTAAPSDIVLTHPALSAVSVVKYGSQHVKPFLSHRFD